MSTDTLCPHVLAALEARTLAQRVVRRLSGGMTPVQIFHRLPEAVQSDLLAGETNAEVASRQALAQLQRALDVLVAAGSLSRHKVPLQSDEGRGPRGILVDVYRLTPRRRTSLWGTG